MEAMEALAGFDNSHHHRDWPRDMMMVAKVQVHWQVSYGAAGWHTVTVTVTTSASSFKLGICTYLLLSINETIVK